MVRSSDGGWLVLGVVGGLKARRLDGLIVGWLDGSDGQMVGWSDFGVAGCTKGQTVGWFNGWMVRLLDGWMI
jgi:hypothetical protein